VGPNLGNPPFSDATPAWNRYRFIGAVRNIADGSVPARQFEICPVAKIGRHSQYYFAQEYLPAIMGAWTPYDLSDTLPPTTMRGNLVAWVWGSNGNLGLRLRPPGTWNMLNPTRQQIYKFEAHQGWDEENSESRICGWVRTDEDQFIEYQNWDWGGSYGQRIHVVGYEEYPDDIGDHVF
jgi:hypothetical protein